MRNIKPVHDYKNPFPDQEKTFMRTLQASAPDNDNDDPPTTEPSTLRPIDDLALADEALRKADEWTDQVRQAA